MNCKSFTQPTWVQFKYAFLPSRELLQRYHPLEFAINLKSGLLMFQLLNWKKERATKWTVPTEQKQEEVKVATQRYNYLEISITALDEN